MARLIFSLPTVLPALLVLGVGFISAVSHRWEAENPTAIQPKQLPSSSPKDEKLAPKGEAKEDVLPRPLPSGKTP